VQHAGVLTVKRLRWHDLGTLPAVAPGANGVAITNLTSDARGNAPVMIAQPCVQQNKAWANSPAAAVLLRYAGAWSAGH
jgi:hypothetical protein